MWSIVGVAAYSVFIAWTAMIVDAQLGRKAVPDQGLGYNYHTYAKQAVS